MKEFNSSEIGTFIYFKIYFKNFHLKVLISSKIR
jgi:hypothetical protein